MTSITANMHQPEHAKAIQSSLDASWLTIGDLRDSTTFTIFMPILRARAMADAFNRPAPDLLALIDKRLTQVAQTGDADFTYRDCVIQPNELGGFDWADLTADTHDGSGCAETLLTTLDDIDDYRAAPEPEPLDAETIAQRHESYRQTLIDAGRGHLAA